MIAPAAFEIPSLFEQNYAKIKVILPVLRQQLLSEHAGTKISSPFTAASFATAGAAGAAATAENFDD